MSRDDLFFAPSQPAPSVVKTDPLSGEPAPARRAPLAARLRPRNLSEFIGQSHILAEGMLLRRAIEAALAAC